ncbi:hypothetical protein AC578_4695 [Pseudocercospora eumusae]|uniref:Uncharacterized protein n=1 Tax=Pseudocercospora eumusae TaxID=321146 RepID=A0A139H7G1_9PEZI|nr:hypothetical protein AC578_4695 [Pseudocercospora eumusae]
MAPPKQSTELKNRALPPWFGEKHSEDRLCKVRKFPAVLQVTTDTGRETFGTFEKDSPFRIQKARIASLKNTYGSRIPPLTDAGLDPRQFPNNYREEVYLVEADQTESIETVGGEGGQKILQMVLKKDAHFTGRRQQADSFDAGTSQAKLASIFRKTAGLKVNVTMKLDKDDEVKVLRHIPIMMSARKCTTDEKPRDDFFFARFAEYGRNSAQPFDNYRSNRVELPYMP